MAMNMCRRHNINTMAAAMAIISLYQAHCRPVHGSAPMHQRKFLVSAARRNARIVATN